MKIERRRAVDRVHQAIREAILDRRFPPRMRLNVEDLASQLESALRLFAVRSSCLPPKVWLTFIRGVGPSWRPFPARDIEKTFDIRCALECLAGEKAVEQLMIRTWSGHASSSQSCSSRLETTAS